MISKFPERRTAFDEGSQTEVYGIDAILIDLYNGNREILDEEMKRMRGRLFASIDEHMATTHDNAARQMYREIVRLITSECWRGVQKGQTRAFRREKMALGVGPDVTFTRKKPRGRDDEGEQAA